MVSQRYVFDRPDRFVVGTVGQPGDRTFFLQARDGNRVVSVVLEKVQVVVLAERLGQLLDELERHGLATAPDGLAPPDLDPLDEPVLEAFRAGTLTLGWDADAQQVIVEAREQGEIDLQVEEGEQEIQLVVEDEEGDEAQDELAVRLTSVAARAFVERATRVVASGRPPCPMCGQPLDQQGHLCPRRNGHYLN